MVHSARTKKIFFEKNNIYSTLWPHVKVSWWWRYRQILPPITRRVVLVRRRLHFPQKSEDTILMSGDSPFELAMEVLKNAADYVVDMSNPVSIESMPSTLGMQCSQCGRYGANIKQTFADKFGANRVTRNVCQTCFGNR